MIRKISENTKLAILRKTPFAHGTRPSADGMPAEQVKKMFYTAIVDEDDSVLAEMERMRQEANADIAAKMDADKLCDDVEAHVDSHHYPSTLAMCRYVDRVGNAFRLHYTDLRVPAASWTALDTAVGGYGYVAHVPIAEVRASMIPEVCFAPADAARPQLATFCHSGEGRVSIYSTEALDTEVVVELLTCWVPTYYSVLATAPHATVRVADALGKTYASGDFVAAGETLTVSVQPDDGYAVSSFAVNHYYYAADATVTVAATGTVHVAVSTEEV